MDEFARTTDGALTRVALFKKLRVLFKKREGNDPSGK